MTDKGLIFKIYEQLIQHNIKTNKQPKQKMGKRTVNQNYNGASYQSQMQSSKGDLTAMELLRSM